jgi:hypothetical protein
MNFKVFFKFLCPHALKFISFCQNCGLWVRVRIQLNVYLLCETIIIFKWSGSVTFWCGSGSSIHTFDISDPDPDAGADPAPDPALFVSDLQDANKKYFLCSFLSFEGTFTSFFKDKKS